MPTVALDTRDAFVNMAENLGINASEAEDLVDLYLEEADKMSEPGAPESPRVTVVHQPIKAATNGHAPPVAEPAVVLNPDADRPLGRSHAFYRRARCHARYAGQPTSFW